LGRVKEGDLSKKHPSGGRPPENDKKSGPQNFLKAEAGSLDRPTYRRDEPDKTLKKTHQRNELAEKKKTVSQPRRVTQKKTGLLSETKGRGTHKCPPRKKNWGNTTFWGRVTGVQGRIIKSPTSETLTRQSTRNDLTDQGPGLRKGEKKVFF